MATTSNQVNILLRIFNRRWKWHAAFWLVYFAATLPGEFRSIWFLPGTIERLNQLSHLQVDISALQVTFVIAFNDLTIIFYTYFIIFYLYPAFFARQRYIWFTILGFGLAVLLNAMMVNIAYSVSPFLINNDWVGTFLSDFTVYPLFLFLVTMCKFFKDSLIQQQFDSQKTIAAKQAELNNLKAQLSPHFLFNTMNNFYGLAVAQSKQLPSLMLLLSELMRYSLYGTNREKVPLEDEIRYLKNYVELEKIRLEDTLQLDFLTNILDDKNVQIAPLILIVFVENAFKHSRLIQNTAINIKIKIHLDDTGWLEFKVENNYTPISNDFSKSGINSINSDGGIGLGNVKKRLELLYPHDLHVLSFADDGHFFKVNLQIKLQ
jgi:hypothetical protein